MGEGALAYEVHRARAARAHVVHRIIRSHSKRGAAITFRVGSLEIGTRLLHIASGLAGCHGQLKYTRQRQGSDAAGRSEGHRHRHSKERIT
jgi:hypothetical protein